MRVTSAIWVGAYIRRCYAAGAIATVVRRGAEEAGAIFVTVDRLDNTADLYGPAPQSAFDESHPGDRLFQQIETLAAADAITARLDRERKFDPDVWILAVEDKAGRCLLDLVRDG